MPNQQTISHITSLQTNSDKTTVSFKARIAARTAQFELGLGITNIESHPVYSTVLARAIVDENSR